MKKRPFKVYLLVALSITGGLFILAKLLGVAGIFRMSSDSMMPTYAPGEHLLVCKWPSIDRNDVVAYFDTSLAVFGYREAKRDLFVGRIVAAGGDELEMSKGRVLINGQALEQDADLLFYWCLAKADYLANQAHFKDSPIPLSLYPDSVLVALQEPQALEIQKRVPMRFYDFPLTRPDGVYSWGERNWTMNKLGPITIPPGLVFILGDHRHNSEDSRLRGLVPESDIYGKVIF